MSLYFCETYSTLPKSPAADAPWDDKEEKAQIAEKTVALLWVTVFYKQLDLSFLYMPS